MKKYNWLNQSIIRPLVWVFGGLCLLIIGISVVWLPPILSFGFIGISILIGLLLMKPHWLLISMLLLRSVAESAQDLFILFPESWYNVNSAGLLNILACFIGIFIITRRFARGKRVLPSLPMSILSLFLIVGSIGLIISIDTPASFKSWARFAGYLGIALLALEVAADKMAMRKSLLAIIITAVPQLILGYFQSATGSGYFFPGFLDSQFAYRPTGTFGHPAILASFLITIICLTLSAFLLDSSLMPRLLIGVFIIACLGLLVLTFARSEWIGGIIAFGLITFIRSKKLIIIGILAGLVLLAILPAVQDRLSGEQARTTLDWRLAVWDASLKVMEQPTVIGHGLDTSPILVNRELVNVIAPPHNDYLRNAIETGVLGLLFFLLLQGALVFHGWQSYNSRKMDLIRVMGLALLGIAVGGAAISLTDNYFSYVSVQWYNWTIVGLLSVKSTFRIT